MIINITKAAYLRDYVVYLEFDNGSKGIADLSDRVGRGGVFEPLKDKSYFRELSLNEKLGTICWPNGADIAPDFLYSKITKTLH